MHCPDVALWYLRLNGCLTVPNFVLHPSRRGPQLTDADIVAVRFPYRTEFDEDSDDAEFTTLEKKPLFVIAEVAAGECKINEPWKRADSIAYVLRAFGPIADPNIPAVAESWVRTGSYSDETIRCSFLCFGARPNEAVNLEYPGVPQKTWDDIIHFFHSRFSSYFRRKRDHEQWDLVGNTLWEQWEESRHDVEKFSRNIKDECGLPA